MVSARFRAGLAGLVLMLCVSTASAQTAPELSATVNLSDVTLTWTAVPGATSYEFFTLVGAQLVGPIGVGNVLTRTLPGVPNGVYQVAVRAANGAVKGPFSNILTLTVTGLPAVPPAAPTDLTAAISGNSVLLSWNLAAPSTLAGLLLQVGSSTGASDMGVFPIRVSTSAFLGTVPNGNYFMRLIAIGSGGPSPASNELNLAVPSCVAPTTLPFTASSTNGLVQGSWPTIPGATGYRLAASSTPGGAPDLGSFSIPANQTSFSHFGAPTGTYYLTLHATLSCGPTVSSLEVAVDVTKPVRQPAKSFSHATSLVLAAVTSTGGIGSSCGNNTWLFAALQKLRLQDDRFGNNWKRGVVGDMSQDVFLYNFSDLPNEQAGAAQVYAWDVIGSHCGGNPAPQANNITDARGSAGWTIRNYLNAGFAP